MNKGFLHSVLWIVLGALIVLTACYWLGSITVGDWDLRPVDMLADLREDTLADPSQAIKELKVEQAERIDSCRPGMTCINDMSVPGEAWGMESFYNALDSVRSLGRPVRIAVLGDSYIEGDILTAHLRTVLQDRFGGCGTGYLPLTSIVAGFRSTVRQSFGGWGEHHAVGGDGGYSSTWANLTGHYYTAGAGAWVDIRSTDVLPHLAACRQSSFYFAGTGSGEVTAVADGVTQRFTLNGAGGVDKVSVTADTLRNVKWTVTRGGGLTYLGASMDPLDGVIVDNYGLRSSSGLHLKMVGDAMWQGFDRARHYDLVILMWGLNVAGKNTKDYTSYIASMTEAIENMKRNMPGTSILVLSSSDREGRANGSFRTYPGVINLINAQQQIAYDTHTAFWNLYEAMGGQGSIVAMVQNHEAGSDYTHINFKGGEHIAGLLTDALLWGYECHQMSQQRLNGGK